MGILTERRAVAELQPHPLSRSIFGHLPADEFEALKADISRRGLKHMLEVDGYGLVVCGGERLRALQELGAGQVTVVVHPQLLDGDEVVEHLILDNLLRRHLVPSQRYRAGKELERIESARARQRMKAAGMGQPIAPEEKGQAADKVAQQLSTSRRTYERIKEIWEHGSADLQEQVDRGQVSIAKAATLVHRLRRGERRTGQVVRLEGEDPRTHLLRLGKLRHEGDKLQVFLRAHCLANFGPHADDARGYLEELCHEVRAFLARPAAVAQEAAA